MDGTAAFRRGVLCSGGGCRIDLDVDQQLECADGKDALDEVVHLCPDFFLECAVAKNGRGRRTQVVTVAEIVGDRDLVALQPVASCYVETNPSGNGKGEYGRPARTIEVEKDTGARSGILTVEKRTPAGEIDNHRRPINPLDARYC